VDCGSEEVGEIEASVLERISVRIKPLVSHVGR